MNSLNGSADRGAGGFADHLRHVQGGGPPDDDDQCEVALEAWGSWG